MTFGEYTRHIDWSLTVGRRRTRQTARQAASTMRELEGARALPEAEEAVDDPLRMARSLLAGTSQRSPALTHRVPRVPGQDPDAKSASRGPD